jgi:hypothetical protein
MTGSVSGFSHHRGFHGRGVPVPFASRSGKLKEEAVVRESLTKGASQHVEGRRETERCIRNRLE